MRKVSTSIVRVISITLLCFIVVRTGHAQEPPRDLPDTIMSRTALLNELSLLRDSIVIALEQIPESSANQAISAAHDSVALELTRYRNLLDKAIADVDDPEQFWNDELYNRNYQVLKRVRRGYKMIRQEAD